FSSLFLNYSSAFAVYTLSLHDALPILSVVFIRRQQVLQEPLVELTLFRSAAFSVSVAISVLNVFVSFGSFILIAQYLQLVQVLRSEEHTSELQSHLNLVCRLLLEKKK